VSQPAPERWSTSQAQDLLRKAGAHDLCLHEPPPPPPGVRLRDCSSDMTTRTSPPKPSSPAEPGRATAHKHEDLYLLRWEGHGDGLNRLFDGNNEAYSAGHTVELDLPGVRDRITAGYEKTVEYGQNTRQDQWGAPTSWNPAAQKMTCPSGEQVKSSPTIVVPPGKQAIVQGRTVAPAPRGSQWPELARLDYRVHVMEDAQLSLRNVLMADLVVFAWPKFAARYNPFAPDGLSQLQTAPGGGAVVRTN
jgi:hypothetical protein